MDPVCVVTIPEAERFRVVKVRPKWHDRLLAARAVYVGVLSMIPRPPARRNQIDTRLVEVDRGLAEHLRNVNYLVRLKCQSSNIPTSDTAHDHEPILTSQGPSCSRGSLALSPNIWFRCGSGWIEEMIKHEVGGLTWTRHYGLGDKFRIGLRAAVPAAGPAFPLPRHFPLIEGFSLPHGYTMFINVERPSNGVSACGLLCSVVIKQGDDLVRHNTCRIGGLLSVTDRNGASKLVGVTSGHALLDRVLTTSAGHPNASEARPAPDAARGRFTKAASTSRWRRGTSKSQSFPQAPVAAPSRGVVSLQKVEDTNWDIVRGIHCINWLGGGWETLAEFQFPFAVPQPERLTADADFALLELPPHLQNTFRVASGWDQRITTLLSENEISDDKVHVVLGPDDVVLGQLLSDRSNLYLRGRLFPAMKIQLEQPLAIGVSGSWVVQNGGLCGMISMIYEDEPFAYMITTDKIVHDIKKTLDMKFEVTLPRELVTESHVSQLQTLSSVESLLLHAESLAGAYRNPVRDATGNRFLNQMAGSDAEDETKPILVTTGQSPQLLPGKALVPSELSAESLTLALVPSPIDKSKYFMPIGAIEKIMDYRSVKAKLDSIMPRNENNKWLAGYVVSKASRIFAILILMRKPESIVSFYIQEIGDTDLPFHRDEVDGAEIRLHLRSDRKETGIHIEAFATWSPLDIISFDNYQWYMVSPFFRGRDERTTPFYSLHKRTILPFIEYDAEGRKGSFATVRRARIHPAHHNFDSMTRPAFQYSDYFAIKQYHKGPEEHFRDELEAFQKLQHQNRSIQLLAAFELGDSYYLILPWADGGSLREMWRTHRLRQPVSPETIVWFLGECMGLAQGLDDMHGGYGRRTDEASANTTTDPSEVEDSIMVRHGDIKPENILCFLGKDDSLTREGSYGTLAFADFGSTTFHNGDTVGRAMSRNVQRTLTYRAPETDTEPILSRLSDTWSLGCVFLEFSTWLLLGVEGVDDFATARMEETEKDNEGPWYEDDSYFVTRKHRGLRTGNYQKVKATVAQWIGTLATASSCTTELHEFLMIIKTRMIVVHPDKRVTAAKLVEDLVRLRSKASNRKSPETAKVVGTASPDPTPAADKTPDTQPKLQAPGANAIKEALHKDTNEVVAMKNASPFELLPPTSRLPTPHEQTEPVLTKTTNEFILEHQPKTGDTRLTQRRTVEQLHLGAAWRVAQARAAVTKGAASGKPAANYKEEFKGLSAEQLAGVHADLAAQLSAVAEIQRDNLAGSISSGP